MEKAGLLRSVWEDPDGGRGRRPPAAPPLLDHLGGSGHPRPSAFRGRSEHPVRSRLEPVVRPEPVPGPRLVRRWIDVYTRGLPAGEVERRRLELASDQWEQIHDPDEPSTGLVLMSRCIRGIPADVRWRYRTLLDERGARQRSSDMPEARNNNWWMITVAIFGAVTAINSVGPALVGGSGTDDPVGDVFRIIGVVTGLAGRRASPRGPLVLGRQVVAGTWMVIIGSLMGTVPFLLPVGVLVIASGFWTGNLRLKAGARGIRRRPASGPSAARPPLVRPPRPLVPVARCRRGSGRLRLPFPAPRVHRELGLRVRGGGLHGRGQRRRLDDLVGELVRRSRGGRHRCRPGRGPWCQSPPHEAGLTVHPVGCHVYGGGPGFRPGPPPRPTASAGHTEALHPDRLGLDPQIDQQARGRVGEAGRAADVGGGVGPDRGGRGRRR